MILQLSLSPPLSRQISDLAPAEGIHPDREVGEKRMSRITVHAIHGPNYYKDTKPLRPYFFKIDLQRDLATIVYLSEDPSPPRLFVWGGKAIL